MDAAKRLFAMQLELERELLVSAFSNLLDARDHLSISRGYLELERNHCDPLDVAAVETALAAAAERCLERRRLIPFLVRLRSCTAWAQINHQFAA